MLSKLITALVVLTAVLPAMANTRGPSTAEERMRVVDYARSLEQNPLAKDGLQKRIWLTEWIVRVPDVTVNPCCSSLFSLDKVNNTYSNQLRMQAIYSQTAFMLEHPGAKDEAAAQAAGLEGTLRAYKAIQRIDPTARYPLLDNLLTLERKGKLEKYVARQQKCPSN